MLARYKGWCSFEPVSPDWSPARDPWFVRQWLASLGVDPSKEDQLPLGVGGPGGGGPWPHGGSGGGSFTAVASSEKEWGERGARLSSDGGGAESADVGVTSPLQGNEGE